MRRRGREDYRFTKILVLNRNFVCLNNQSLNGMMAPERFCGTSKRQSWRVSKVSLQFARDSERAMCFDAKRRPPRVSRDGSGPIVMHFCGSDLSASR